MVAGNGREVGGRNDTLAAGSEGGGLDRQGEYTFAKKKAPAKAKAKAEAAKAG